MSSASKYIGMCQPYDPDDNYQVGEHGLVPESAYLVPSGSHGDYSPILVIPVSARHAVVVERHNARLRMYKINVNGGVYDPLVEECDVPQRNFNPYNVWLDQYKWELPYENSIVGGYSPHKNRVMIVARDPYPFQEETTYLIEWGEPYGGCRSLTLNYHLYYFDVRHEDDIRMLWNDVYVDQVLFPAYLNTEIYDEYEDVYGWSWRIGYEVDVGEDVPSGVSGLLDEFTRRLGVYYDTQFPERELTIIGDDFDFTTRFPEWMNDVVYTPARVYDLDFLIDPSEYDEIIYNYVYYWNTIMYTQAGYPVPEEVLARIPAEAAAAIAFAASHQWYAGPVTWGKRARRLVSSGGGSRIYISAVPSHTGIVQIDSDGLDEQHSAGSLIQDSSGGGDPV